MLQVVGPVGAAALAVDRLRPGYQPRSLVRLVDAAPAGFVVLGGRGRDLVLPREATVVEALEHEDDVGDGVIYGEDDHGGQNSLQDGAKDVEDIAEQPDDDKLDRKALGAAPAEVLDDLGGEDDDPARNGDGTRGTKRFLSVVGFGLICRCGACAAVACVKTYPQMPEMASTSRFNGPVGGAIITLSLFLLLFPLFPLFSLSLSVCVSLSHSLYRPLQVFARSEVVGNMDSRSLRNRRGPEDAGFVETRRCSLSNLAASVSPSKRKRKIGPGMTQVGLGAEENLKDNKINY